MKLERVDLRHCSRCQGLEERELLSIVAFMKHVFLQMRVCREVDRGERNVTQKTSTCTLVQTEESQLSHDMYCTLGSSTFELGGLSLDLQTNLTKSSQLVQSQFDQYRGK